MVLVKSMKALVVSSKHRDMLALTLWDGLQQVLGEANVVDAVGSPSLRRSSALDYLAVHGEDSESHRHLNTAFTCQELGATREGRTWDAAGEEDFDLVVVHSCFGDDSDWQEARDLLAHLGDGGKVAWVDGADDSRHVVERPFGSDAVFRKEIAPGRTYPYGDSLYHLGFAAPERWFAGTEVREGARDIDVLFVGSVESDGSPRWEMCSKVFQCRRRHKAVVASVGMGWPNYTALLRRAKFALCPSAAAGADSLRTYEAVSAGAIPVFVSYPPRCRDPWFPPEVSVTVQDVNSLPGVLDSCLDGHDLAPMRRKLREWALEHHTTRARALKVLTTLGFREGEDF